MFVGLGRWLWLQQLLPLGIVLTSKGGSGYLAAWLIRHGTGT